MKKTGKAIIFFILIAVVQWAVMGKMIYDQTDIRKSGKAFLFEIQPIDPVDPFRGNYIILSFKENTIAKKDTMEIWRNGDKIYLALEKGEDNMTKITEYSATKYSNDQDYLQAKVDFTTLDGALRIRYPFNRFYLDEERALRAEGNFFNRSDTSETPSYAVVYIHKGNASVADVMVEGASVLE